MLRAAPLRSRAGLHPGDLVIPRARVRARGLVARSQMSCFSLQMSMAPVVISGLLQGFGLGSTQVPLNIIALSTLPRHIMTQGRLSAS